MPNAPEAGELLVRIVIASPTGICFGVKRAVKNLEEALRDKGKVYALGSPMHNPQEIERLKKMGLVVVESPEEIPFGAVSFVRAHGITPESFSELKKRSSMVVDSTCPFVKNAQEKAKELSQDDYLVVISGDKTHPEVKGIVGFTKYAKSDVLVISSGGDIPDSVKGRRIGILSQTTHKAADFALLVQALVPLSPEIKVYNTICKETLARQKSIRELASKVDGIVILGGRNSANTRQLAEIAWDAAVPTIWIEHAGELNRGWLQNREIIGIAAGGSTPDWLIEELIAKIKMT